MIEEGRRKRPMIPRNERLCDTCNKLEDEIHFLIECDNYKCERFEKFKAITEEIPTFEQMTDSKAKFIFLMTQENEKLLNLIASCTHDWFKLLNLIASCTHDWFKLLNLIASCTHDWFKLRNTHNVRS